MVVSVLYIYAVLLILGGFLGYRNAGSKVSLFMGIVSGTIVLNGCLLTSSQPSAGFSMIFGTALVLSIVFTIRLLKTKKFMPAGLLIIFSLIALVISFSQLTG